MVHHRLARRRSEGLRHVLRHQALTSRGLDRSVGLTGVHVLVAGDRLARGLHHAALQARVARVSHYYGAAELSFVAWGSHADDLRPFPGVEVECREGVLWVRSPYVCLGYDGPAGPLARDQDGFVAVGDRGSWADGHLRVHGRAGDTVVTAGATVLVAEVESALEQVTGRPVVVGLPHPDLGQVLCGVVTDRREVPTLRRAARDLLAPAQRPGRWFETATLPLTSAGKLDREALTDMLESREGARAVV